MGRARNLFVLLALALVAAALTAGPASAGSPIVIPHPTFPQCTPDGPQGTDTLNAPALPEDTQCYPMPGVPIISTQYSAIVAGGYMSLQGAIEKDGYQVVWDDLGSGTPVIQGALHRWVFPLPGLYGWHCSCTNPGTRADGRVYVVGPAPRINPIMTSPTNDPPVSYTLDGNISSVTDWSPFNIKKYEWDLNEDGVYSGQPPDQTGPEPTAPISFATAGAHGVGLRVTDDFMSGDPLMPTPRTVEAVITINVPKPTTGGGTVTTPPDNGDTADKQKTFDETYFKQHVKLTARAKVTISALRKNGLLVKVSGLRSGDVVGGSLTAAKKVKKKTVKKSLGSKTGRASSTSVTLRIRLRKSAMKIIRSKPKSKTIRLGIKVEGADGYTVSKAKNIKLG